MRIIIFGQYKTGTTALFHRIRVALPADTPTLFEPTHLPTHLTHTTRLLAKVILDAPGPTSSTVDYPSFGQPDRALYLVRDPRDWLVSATLFLAQSLPPVWQDEARLGRVMEMLAHKQADPGSLPLLRVLELLASSMEIKSLTAVLAWIQRQHDWLVTFERRPLHPVRYEEMVAGRLSALEAYLDLSLEAMPELPPAHAHVPRTCGSGNWRQWFTPEDVSTLRPLFAPYLKRHGYPDDWRLDPEPVIPARHGTEYVARTVTLRGEKEAIRRKSTR